MFGKVVVLAMGATLVPLASLAQEQATALGRTLVSTYCAECHATGHRGDSPFSPAPPFRDLHLRYDVEFLSEALVEGLVSAHPAMPEFEFDPDQAAAIVAYLKSLEAPVPSVPLAQQIAYGALTFQVYCVSCHGTGGRGDSEAAASLRPADLTLLADKNGGAFPDERVRRAIDGRAERVGHVGGGHAALGPTVCSRTGGRGSGVGARGACCHAHRQPHQFPAIDSEVTRMKCLAICTLALSMVLETTTMAQESSVALGRVTFMEHCAVCHGADAKGETPVRGAIAAPDLTLLSRRGGGVFPRESVRRLIDGQEDEQLHAGPMPAWGLLLSSAGGARSIEHIVDYLASVQAARE